MTIRGVHIIRAGVTTGSVCGETRRQVRVTRASPSTSLPRCVASLPPSSLHAWLLLEQTSHTSHICAALPSRLTDPACSDKLDGNCPARVL